MCVYVAIRALQHAGGFISQHGLQVCERASRALALSLLAHSTALQCVAVALCGWPDPLLRGWQERRSRLAVLQPCLRAPDCTAALSAAGCGCSGTCSCELCASWGEPCTPCGHCFLSEAHTTARSTAHLHLPHLCRLICSNNCTLACQQSAHIFTPDVCLHLNCQQAAAQQ